MVQYPGLSPPTSEAQVQHPAGAPRPCQPHSSGEKKERKKIIKKNKMKQTKNQKSPPKKDRQNPRPNGKNKPKKTITQISIHIHTQRKRKTIF